MNKEIDLLFDERIKKEYQSIHKKTVKFNKSTRHEYKIIRACEQYKTINENDNLHTKILKRYLITKKVKDVATYINDLGYRINSNSLQGCRKYLGKDISDLIDLDKDKINADKLLIEVCKDIRYKTKYFKELGKW